MLRFTEIGRLYSRKGPSSSHKRTNSSSSATSSTSSSSSTRTALDRRLSINVVGQERDGVFLVARDDLFLNRTCIELVEIKTPNVSSAATSSAAPMSNSVDYSSIDRDGESRRREEASQVTVADNYAVERRVIYVHDNVMKCVAASVNYDKTILAFTTFKKFASVSNSSTDGNGTDGGMTSVSSPSSLASPSSSISLTGNVMEHGERGVYDSFLVEVERKNGNNRFHFNIRGSQFQNIQFIHENATKRNSSFLFFRDKDRIEMYSLLTEKKRGSGFTEIVAQPELQATFVKRYIWSQWDPQHSLLYYLMPHKDVQKSTTYYGANHHRPNASNASNSKPIPLECNLRCCSFTDVRRPFLLFEYVLTVMLPPKMLSDGAQSDLYDNRIPWKAGHTSPDSSIFFNIVQLNKDAICLCQQHIFNMNKANPEIDITIYMLHHRRKATFTIPLKQFQPKTLRRCRVIFGVIDNMLSVYIPGHYLRLIDCGLEHEPWDFLTFTGEDVPHLPHSSKRATANTASQSTTIPLGVLVSMGRNNHNSGYAILNLRKGHVHEVKFAYDPLIRWLERQRRSDQFVKMVHLALTHIEDDTFTTRVLYSLCTTLCKYVSIDVFIEFLVGSIYMLLKYKKVDKEFLRIVPISIKERDTRTSRNFKLVKMKDDFTIYSQKILLENRHAFALSIIELVKQHPSMVLGLPDVALAQRMEEQITPPSPARKRSTGLFGLFRSRRDEMQEGEQEEEEVDEFTKTQRRLFLECIRDVLPSAYALSLKDAKTKCAKWCNDYNAMVLKQSAYLFKWIQKLYSSSNRTNANDEENYNSNRNDVKNATVFESDFGSIQPSRTYFHLLETLWSALEETCFPPPKGFTNHIGHVAFEVLPQKMFMQYATRGVVHITLELAEYVFSRIASPRVPSTEPGQWNAMEFVNISEEDKQFFALLLKKLQDESASTEIRFHARITGPMSSVLEFYHSVAGSQSPDPNLLLSSYNNVIDRAFTSVIPRGAALSRLPEDERALFFFRQANRVLFEHLRSSKFAPMTLFLLSLIITSRHELPHASDRRTPSAASHSAKGLGLGSLFFNSSSSGQDSDETDAVGSRSPDMISHEIEMAQLQDHLLDYVTANVDNVRVMEDEWQSNMT